MARQGKTAAAKGGVDAGSGAAAKVRAGHGRNSSVGELNGDEHGGRSAAAWIGLFWKLKRRRTITGLG